MKDCDSEKCSSKPGPLQESKSIQTETLSVLQIYKQVFDVQRFFGSSRFVITEISQNQQNPSTLNDFQPFVHFSICKSPLTAFKYYASKTLFTIYLAFFISRFIKVVNADDAKIARCNFHDKGGCLLAISCYIIEQSMVIGIYYWSHRKQDKLCKFFNAFNTLDSYIFGTGNYAVNIKN